MMKKNLIREGAGTETDPELSQKRKTTIKQERIRGSAIKKEAKSGSKVSCTKIRTLSMRNGNRIRMQFTTQFLQPTDSLKSKIKFLNEKMFYSEEEAGGTKLENPVAVSDPADGANLIPGTLFSGNELLERGRIESPEMTEHKTVILRASRSNSSKIAERKIVQVNGNDFREEVRAAIAQLINPCGFSENLPEKQLQSAESTTEDFLKLKVAPSSYFMDVSSANNTVSNAQAANYFYMFFFTQNYMNISGQPSLDFLTENIQLPSDCFYIDEVEYGRQLLIIFESPIRLDKIGMSPSGTLNWEKFCSALSAEPDDSNLIRQISLRVHGSGKSAYMETDVRKAKAAVDEYFAVPMPDCPPVPVSFRISDLQGKPVGLKTEVLIRQKNSLPTRKIRVSIKSITLLPAEDSLISYEELSGCICIYVYNDKNRVMLSDGKEMPSYLESLNPPTIRIRYGNADLPLRLKPGTTLNQSSSVLNSKPVNLSVDNLQYRIKIYPSGSKGEGITSQQDKRHDSFDKTVGQIIQEGILEKTLFFNEGNSQVEVTVNIIPF